MNKISKVILALIALFALLTTLTMTKGILFKFNCPDDRFAVAIDDDGRVAYAYLLKLDEMCADVWLYNRCETPEEPEWLMGPELLPFANSREYVKDDSYKILPVTEDDFDVHYEFNEDDEFARAYIYIKDKLIASLAEGEKPGYSNLVSKSGPLAKKMSKGNQPNQRPRFPRK